MTSEPAIPEPALLDPVEAERRRALAVAEADAAFVAGQRAAMGLGGVEAEAKEAERRRLEEEQRRRLDLFGDPRLRPGNANLPAPERENRKARRAKAALARLAPPQAKRGRRAGGRAAAALVEAQAPGKIAKD